MAHTSLDRVDSVGPVFFCGLDPRRSASRGVPGFAPARGLAQHPVFFTLRAAQPAVEPSARAYEAVGFREAWCRLRDPAANDRITGIDGLMRPDQARDARSREPYALHGLAPDVANFSGLLTFGDRLADRHLEAQKP